MNKTNGPITFCKRRVHLFVCLFVCLFDVIFSTGDNFEQILRGSNPTPVEDFRLIPRNFNFQVMHKPDIVLSWRLAHLYPL